MTELDLRRQPELPTPAGSRDELTRWLAAALADALQMDASSIGPRVPLWEYGVDSLVSATLLAELDDELGIWVDPGDVPPGICLDELAAIVLQSEQLAA